MSKLFVRVEFEIDCIPVSWENSFVHNELDYTLSDGLTRIDGIVKMSKKNVKMSNVCL